MLNLKTLLKAPPTFWNVSIVLSVKKTFKTKMKENEVACPYQVTLKLNTIFRVCSVQRQKKRKIWIKLNLVEIL